MCIYMYIYRERDIHAYIHIHVCTYIYIYIYTHTYWRGWRNVFRCLLFSFALLDLGTSSLRRGRSNLLCIVQTLTDDLRRESTASLLAGRGGGGALFAVSVRVRRLRFSAQSSEAWWQGGMPLESCPLQSWTQWNRSPAPMFLCVRQYIGAREPLFRANESRREPQPYSTKLWPALARDHDARDERATAAKLWLVYTTSIYTYQPINMFRI